MLGGKGSEDPAIAPDFCPIGHLSGIHSRPQRGSAAAAFVVFAGFRSEEKLRSLLVVGHTVLHHGDLDRLQAGRTEERPFQGAPGDCRALHVSVPSSFLADDGVNALVPTLVKGVEFIQLRGVANDGPKGFRKGLRQLAHPLLCHMGRTEDDIKGLLPGLPASHSGRGRDRSGQGGRPDFRFPGTAFRHDECELIFGELLSDRFCHGQLRGVERIARVFPDVLVDGEDLRGKRLCRRIEQRLELVADALRHGDAEGVQVACDVAHGVEAVRFSDGPRNGDCSASQPVLHHGNDVGVVLLAEQDPGFQLLPDGDNGQPLQDTPVFQLREQIVPKLRDQRHGGFAVHFLEEMVPVPCGAEDHALPRRQVGFLL